MRVEDFVILGIGCILIWLAVNKKRSLPSFISDVPKSGQALALLHDNGYEVISGKVRVPLEVQHGGQQSQSRVIIDFIARKHDKMYVVKIKNKRKPERMAAANLRDEYLKLQLLFATDGVLYLDMEKGKINEIEFTYPPVHVRKRFTDYLKIPKWVTIAVIILLLFFILR